MKLGTMLRDILTSLFQRPVTEKYPFEKRAAPRRTRGLLHWHPEKCTGCCLCNSDCPANALELITLDKKAKRFVLRYHPDRCTFCGQCVESCRFDCLEMSSEEWELAATSREPFTITYGQEADIVELLARAPAASNSPTPES
jgi:formate hydrogenlyase subunit 6/NADH:ubiquinone oxidoreductase subunit I